MRAIAVRPQLQFATAVAFVIVAESVLLASRSFALHPQLFRSAVIFDLCAVVPAAWWLLVVRPGQARPRTTARVAVLAIAFCALLFGREVRLLAAPLELALLYIAYTSVRKALEARSASDAATALREGLVEAIGDNPAAHAVASELSVLWFALFSWGRRAPEGFTAYKRAGWSAVYFALAICVLGEGIPLHFVLPRGWAIASAVLHVYTVLWLLGDLRAMQLRPITVSGGVLHLRLGLKWEAEIPLAQIAAAELTQKADGRKLAVLGSPNLVLRLRSPAKLHGLFGIKRAGQVLSLQVDDPEGLARSVR
ncbi:MAG: hypothetical protein ACXWLM_08640 [Myxococcales bacterium]